MKVALVVSIVLNFTFFLYFFLASAEAPEPMKAEVITEKEIVEKRGPVTKIVNDKKGIGEAVHFARKYLDLPYDDKLTESRRRHLVAILKSLVAHDPVALTTLLDFANNTEHLSEDDPEEEDKFFWLKDSVSSWKDITEKIKTDGISSIDDSYLERSFTSSTFGLLMSIKGEMKGADTNICNGDVCEKISLDDELHLEDVEALIDRVSMDGVSDVFKVNIGGSLEDFNNKKIEEFITYSFHKKENKVEYLLGANEEGEDGKMNRNTYSVKYFLTPNTSH